MTHLKRQSAPRNWPIERKGSVYVIGTRVNLNEGIPVLIILRDILKLAQDRREVKRIIHLRQILANDKPIKDEKKTILFFDVLSILPLKKHYRLELSEKGKFYLNEIKESESNHKIAKIIGKKTMKGKKMQLNLSDGRNFLSDIKCSINDSVAINLKTKKIEKCLPLKEKAKVIVFAGKHSGEKGEIIVLNHEEKTAKIKTDEKETNILINQLMVVE